VDDAGSPRFGSWNAPLPAVSLDRARVAGWRGPLGRLRLKQWEHWLVVTPTHALTFAVVDAAFTRLVWLQVIDRKTGERFEHRREGPLVSASLADALWDGASRGRSGTVDVALHNHLAGGGHRAVCRAKTAGLPDVAIDLWAECPLPATEPLVVVHPVGRNRAMYSHKVALPVAGTIAIGGERFAVDRATASAVLDVHKAHYPRETWWNWATAVGFDHRGRRVAFNLTANVAEAGWHENAAWVDGRLTTLGPMARFGLGADPWTADVEGASLTFTGHGERAENLHYGVVESRFRQRYGTFAGTLRAGGEAIEVADWFGLMEDHRARW
jgi:hypothetical protein